MRLRLVVVAAGLLGIAAVSAVALYDGRLVPGVRIAGIAVGSLTEAQARELLTTQTSDASVTLVSGSLSIRLDPTTGIELDVDAAVARAFAVGRYGAFPVRVGDIVGAITAGRDVALAWRIVDGERFARAIERVAASVERLSVDGDVRLGADGVTLRTPRAGVALDRSALVQAVLAATAADATVPLPLRVIEPALDEEAIAPAFEAARAAAQPLVLLAGTERVVLEPARLALIVHIVRVANVDGDRLVAQVDAVGLDALVGEIADALDGGARDAVLVPGGEHLTVIPGRDGVVLDRSAARATIAEAILGPERVVTVPATLTRPALTTVAAQRTADQLVLVGAYATYFPVNRARANNIGAAARTFDGVVVVPGGSFSFWQRIGEVSPRTGYVFAGTIIDGVSSEAIGGGLCQVSTTFFNAVARAGYAIDARYPHSYYIERYPLGLDAAVFAPSTDLRWTNDTAQAALIRAAATDTSVTFWVYSAPLGRTVTFGDPRQWNLRWPSADQPADPAHAPGYVVLGRDVVTTRTVVENGTVVPDDEWYSHYAPVWGGPAR